MILHGIVWYCTAQGVSSHPVDINPRPPHKGIPTQPITSSKAPFSHIFLSAIYPDSFIKLIGFPSLGRFTKNLIERNLNQVIMLPPISRSCAWARSWFPISAPLRSPSPGRMSVSSTLLSHRDVKADGEVPRNPSPGAEMCSHRQNLGDELQPHVNFSVSRVRHHLENKEGGGGAGFTPLPQLLCE